MKAIILNLKTPDYFFLGCFFIILSIWPNRNEARELYVQPSVNVQSLYDDNKRLLTEDRSKGVNTQVFGVITTAASKFGVRSERYDTALATKFKINRYSGEFDLDSEDVFLDLTSNFSLTERSQFGLSANYTLDTSHTSELQVTGLVQDNVDREQWSVAPDWSYYLSDQQIIQANYTHSEVSYAASDISNFFGYTTDVISGSFIQQWTPTFQNYISVSALFFDIPSIPRETTEYSINVGLEYQISETWSTSLNVGGRFTNTEQTVQQLAFNGFFFVVEDVTTSDDTQGLIFSFSTEKQFETGTLSASYSRSTSAQGNGRLQLFDKFSASYSHKISQHLQFLLNGGVNMTSSSGSKNQSIDQGNDQGNDRTYYYIKPSIRWEFIRNASITAGYQYRRQEFDINNQLAVSNSVFINFNYRWDSFSTQKY